MTPCPSCRSRPRPPLLRSCPRGLSRLAAARLPGRPLPRQFAHVGGELADGESNKLMRLSRGGAASTCGFGLYLTLPDI